MQLPSLAMGSMVSLAGRTTILETTKAAVQAIRQNPVVLNLVAIPVGMVDNAPTVVTTSTDGTSRSSDQRLRAHMKDTTDTRHDNGIGVHYSVLKQLLQSFSQQAIEGSMGILTKRQALN